VLDSSPVNIRTAIEGSLKRLDTDRIDPRTADMAYDSARLGEHLASR
jgi:hypothetical protein